MKAIKSVQMVYEAPAELSSLFEDFRLMCNDGLRIALAEKPKSRWVEVDPFGREPKG